MRTQRSAAGTYRRLATALGAGLLIVAIGPRPRAVDYDLRLARAAVAAGTGRPEAALGWLEEAIAFDPALASLNLPAAQLALQAGNAVALRNHLQAAPLWARESTEYACLLAHLPADDNEGSYGAIFRLYRPPAVLKPSRSRESRTRPGFPVRPMRFSGNWMIDPRIFRAGTASQR